VLAYKCWQSFDISLPMEENENDLRLAMLTGDTIDRTNPKNQVHNESF